MDPEDIPKAKELLMEIQEEANRLYGQTNGFDSALELIILNAEHVRQLIDPPDIPEYT